VILLRLLPVLLSFLLLLLLLWLFPLRLHHLFLQLERMLVLLLLLMRLGLLDNHRSGVGLLRDERDTGRGARSKRDSGSHGCRGNSSSNDSFSKLVLLLGQDGGDGGIGRGLRLGDCMLLLDDGSLGNHGSLDGDHLGLGSGSSNGSDRDLDLLCGESGIDRGLLFRQRALQLDGGGGLGSLGSLGNDLGARGLDLGSRRGNLRILLLDRSHVAQRNLARAKLLRMR
jgi:hypothetical protein